VIGRGDPRAAAYLVDAEGVADPTLVERHMAQTQDARGRLVQVDVQVRAEGVSWQAWAEGAYIQEGTAATLAEAQAAAAAAAQDLRFAVDEVRKEAAARTADFLRLFPGDPDSDL